MGSPQRSRRDGKRDVRLSTVDLRSAGTLLCATPGHSVAPNPHSTPIVLWLTGILLTVQGRTRFLGCRGELEFDDDRDGFGTDGSGKRDHYVSRLTSSACRRHDKG